MSTTSTPRVVATPASKRKAQETAVAAALFKLFDSRKNDYAAAKLLFEMNKDLSLDNVVATLNNERLSKGLLSIGRSTLANLIKAWSLVIEAGATPTPETVSAARKAITMGSAASRARAVERVKKVAAEKRDAAFIAAMVDAKASKVESFESKKDAPVKDGAPADAVTGPTEKVSADTVVAQIRAWSKLTWGESDVVAITAAMQRFVLETAPAPVAVPAKAKVSA